ncbi:hypothetical protein HH310_11995 [Actinoplanes sp. TBRC 11911]|uniref:hypothetical protein n=1 Tax=Actinoplanes sp. TBRC 11911 TaxID=2729386 RepID=UPI00145DD8CE|nr:hypothetical protein [Actinoplanes sp. TBRC 11911]NMO51913.1 hypothetical protein [Actinoplanes sp. TBRC 11911]
MPAPRRAALGVALSLLSCLLAGCAVSPATVTRALADRNQDSSLSFDYTADSGGDYIDQVVQIDNNGDEAVIPTLRYIALDANGVGMPEIKVFTAFGSDHGDVVVPTSGAWEIVQFVGEGRDKVADVQVTVLRSQHTDYPYVETEPDTEAFDESGREDEYFANFRSVKVTNDNDDPIRVRLAFVAWQGLDSGADQFQVAVPVGELTTVPAHGDATVEVDPGALTSIFQYGGKYPTNVIAYYSH